METLLQHLETCPTCFAKVPALAAAPDTLVELLAHAKTPPAGWQDPIVAGLITRLTQLRKAPAPGPTMFIFPCPACGKNMKAGANLIGKNLRCPSCTKVIVMPPQPQPATRPADVDEKTLPPRQPVPSVGRASQPVHPQQQGLEMPLSQPVERTGREAHPTPAESFPFLAPARETDELGRLGNYRVLKKLGSGGMGVVFLAEDTLLHRKVALKTMLPAFAASTQNRERFLREARAAASIEHDHIVAIHQVGEENGVPYLAMPLLRGEPLDARLQREGKLPVPEAVRIAAEMAEGLAAAHAAGLIHRDIKPGNVWLEASPGRQSGEYRVKLLDFGLALSQHDNVKLTQSGAVLGTPAYMPPEQAQGETVDARADLFSLGCVLYEMLTGERPFRGDNTISLLAALALQEPTPPRVKNPEVPVGVSDLTMRLLAKKPADRPASAREVARQLRWLLQFANKEQERPDKTTPAKASPFARFAAKAAITTGKFTGKALSHGGAAGLHAAKALIRRPRLAAAVATGCFLLFAWFFGGVIWRIATNRGELVIEADDPNLVVTVKGETVTLYDKVKDRRFVLTAGGYELEVREVGEDGLRFATKKFTITRGGRETFHARLELAQVKHPDGNKGKSPIEAESKEDGVKDKIGHNYSLDFSFLEQQYGLKVKSFAESGAGFEGIFEFGKDLPKIQKEELNGAGLGYLPLRLVFFDHENVNLGPPSGGLRGCDYFLALRRGVISGMKGDAFGVWIDAIPGAGSSEKGFHDFLTKIKKIAIRPAYDPYPVDADLSPSEANTTIQLSSFGQGFDVITFTKGLVDADSVKLKMPHAGVTVAGKDKSVTIRTNLAESGSFDVQVGALGGKKGAVIRVTLKAPPGAKKEDVKKDPYAELFGFRANVALDQNVSGVPRLSAFQQQSLENLRKVHEPEIKSLDAQIAQQGKNAQAVLVELEYRRRKLVRLVERKRNAMVTDAQAAVLGINQNMIPQYATEHALKDPKIWDLSQLEKLFIIESRSFDFHEQVISFMVITKTKWTDAELANDSKNWGSWNDPVPNDGGKVQVRFYNNAEALEFGASPQVTRSNPSLSRASAKLTDKQAEQGLLRWRITISLEAIRGASDTLATTEKRIVAAKFAYPSPK